MLKMGLAQSMNVRRQDRQRHGAPEAAVSDRATAAAAFRERSGFSAPRASRPNVIVKKRWLQCHRRHVLGRLAQLTEHHANPINQQRAVRRSHDGVSVTVLSKRTVCPRSMFSSLATPSSAWLIFSQVSGRIAPMQRCNADFFGKRSGSIRVGGN